MKGILELEQTPLEEGKQTQPPRSVFSRLMAAFNRFAHQGWGDHDRFSHDDRLALQFNLNAAIQQNDLDAARITIRLGANPHWVDVDGQTALHWAASTGQQNACAFLLGLGVDVNAITLEKKRTPLFCAITAGQCKTALFLIEAGADVLRADALGTVPLSRAIATGNLSVCQALVAHGADPQTLGVDESLFAVNPLMGAARDGHEHIALWLLDVGCEPMKGLLNESGQRIEGAMDPLHLSARMGLFTLCARLIDQGLSLRWADNLGDTALHHASEAGLTDIMGLFLSKGSDPLLLNHSGQSALHLAACAGQGDACVVLLKAGADPNRIDNEGRSPKGLARDRGNPHIPPLIDACLNAIAASEAIDRMLGQPPVNKTHHLH